MGRKVSYAKRKKIAILLFTDHELLLKKKNEKCSQAAYISGNIYC